jgi:photosystem II stability/assembly factor-like uncharacterized protein
MQRHLASLVALAVGVLVIASSLSLNSCKTTTETNYDTVYVHDTVFVRDSGTGNHSTSWSYRQSGTSSGLVISQFLSPNLGYVAGENGVVLKTTDVGNTWRALTSVYGGGTLYGVSFTSEMNGFTIGDGSNVHHTTDGGMTWSDYSLPTSKVLRCICFVNPMLGFVGTADPRSSPPGYEGEIYRTTDGGDSWDLVKSIYDGSFYNIQFATATNGIATGKFGTTYWTSDAGTTWISGSNDAPNAQFTHTAFTTATDGFAVAASDPDHGVILRTTDAGHSWTTIKTIPYQLQGIAIPSNNSIITAAGFYGNLLESTDNGTTWTESKLGTDRWMDLTYGSATRAIMIGSLGHIVTRDLQ